MATKQADELVVLRDGGKCHVVDVSEISMIAVSGNYLSVTVHGKDLIHRGSLRRCESLLPSTFFRANRDCVINLALVTPMNVSGRSIEVMVGDREIIMSRKRSSLFMRQRTLWRKSK